MNITKFFIGSILIVFLVSIFATVSNAVEDQVDLENLDTGAAFVLCTPNKKTCTVGKVTMRTTSSEPLHVEDGVVCTPNKKKCTNGYRTLISNGGQLYTAAGVICTTNKHLCAIGKRSMGSSGAELYVRDGIVCSPNKKTCTNGFKTMTSTVPLY